MAHTDACKIQATQFTKKLIDNGMGFNEACRETEKESDGIPASTIKRWWYQVMGETNKRFNNEPTNSQPPETITNPVTPQASSVFLQDRHPQGGGAREGAGRPVSDSSIEEFFIKAKKLAKLAQKIKSAPSFEMRKKELISAANLVAIVITETREDVKWV